MLGIVKVKGAADVVQGDSIVPAEPSMPFNCCP